MKIKNKLESIKKIKELNLNRFPEELFKKGDNEKILDFINKYPYDFYAIRSKDTIDCKFNNFKTPRKKF